MFSLLGLYCFLYFVHFKRCEPYFGQVVAFQSFPDNYFRALVSQALLHLPARDAFSHMYLLHLPNEFSITRVEVRCLDRLCRSATAYYPQRRRCKEVDN